MEKREERVVEEGMVEREKKEKGANESVIESGNERFEKGVTKE
jgi:hypothetical protein